MQFKEGDPVILTNLKYAGRDSDDIADVVIFPTGTKIALFEPLFGPSSLVSASALDEIERLREVLADIIKDCECDYPPSHGAIKYFARAALKEGE